MKEYFDLNIEKVLEHWEIKHALREIIANAIDEQILTNTKDIEIYQKGTWWVIRDYGRGIQNVHFTQNENPEKMSAPNLIGKFGVGLKDALGVLHRHGIPVIITSKHACITTSMSDKNGFNIQTLHAVFEPPKDPTFQGTAFLIKGISKQDIEDAKSMFLRFVPNCKLLEKTKYGEVYSKAKNQAAGIYVNGVLVAEEENFMFSYNITNLNSQIKKALNRERTNVGRVAYSDTIKNILQKSKSDSVLVELINDLKNIVNGTHKDESSWTDVSAHAVKTLNKDGKYVFITPSQSLEFSGTENEIIENSGKKILMVPENVFNKVRNNVYTFDDAYEDYSDSYQYNFVTYDQLQASERIVFDKTEKIIKLLRAWIPEANILKNTKIKISETIRIGHNGEMSLGIYDPLENLIVIKRNVLKSEAQYMGILVHECVHCFTGSNDCTRDFENELTNIIGLILSKSIK